MGTLIPQLTIFVIALVIALWWPNIRRVARIRRPADGVLTDAELGLARVTLPPGWRAASDLNEGAWLQAIDPLRGRYLIVLSESREDFEDAMDLHEHSLRTRKTLGESVRILAMRGPEEREVGGFKAIQYELDASDHLTLLTYLHTTIEGHRAFHQVLAWATRSCFDRATFERLLDGFSETPGPDPRPLAPISQVSVEPQSRYQVH